MTGMPERDQGHRLNAASHWVFHSIKETDHFDSKDNGRDVLYVMFFTMSQLQEDGRMAKDVFSRETCGTTRQESSGLLQAGEDQEPGLRNGRHMNKTDYVSLHGNSGTCCRGDGCQKSFSEEGHMEQHDT